MFHAALWLVARRLGIGWRLLIAVVVEAGWELLENSGFIIERYRAVTISLDYFGDSVINSVSDMGMAVIGFFLARRLPVGASVALIILFEGFTTWMIRGGLTLNVLMLVHPLDAVREWQGAISR